MLITIIHDKNSRKLDIIIQERDKCKNSVNAYKEKSHCDMKYIKEKINIIRNKANISFGKNDLNDIEDRINSLQESLDKIKGIVAPNEKQTSFHTKKLADKAREQEKKRNKLS
jgi:hypothetical protein